MSESVARARIDTLIVYCVSIALVVALWEWAARAFGFLSLFPPPSVTFARLAELLPDRWQAARPPAAPTSTDPSGDSASTSRSDS